MSYRILPLIAALALLASCSGDDGPSTPQPDPRYGPDFTDLGDGSFSTTSIDGWTVAFDDTDEGIDPPEVEEVNGGYGRLRDSDGTNLLPTRVTVTAESQRMFRYVGLDAADLSGLPALDPSSSIHVIGYRIDTMVGEEYYGPTSDDLQTFAAENLEGENLTSLVVEIRSVGGDDFGIARIELTEVDVAWLSFDTLPAGSFEHLFLGEFELTWTGSGDRQRVVDVGGGDMALADLSNANADTARVVLERTDGGGFYLERFWGMDLFEPENHHGNSYVVFEGYQRHQLMTDIYVPVNTAEMYAYDAIGFNDQMIDRLRISIVSICGTFNCDDLAVGGLEVTLED